MPRGKTRKKRTDHENATRLPVHGSMGPRPVAVCVNRGLIPQCAPQSGVWQRFATKWAIWTTRVQVSITGSEFVNCETSPLVHNIAILHQARMWPHLY